MSAAKDRTTAMELLGQSMRELTRRTSEFHPNDPKRGECQNELYALKELKLHNSVKRTN
jgi:hypothetical protein